MNCFNIFSRLSLSLQYCIHNGTSSFLQPSQAILPPSLLSTSNTRNPGSFSLSKILILEIAGINSPLCPKEQAISQVLHPPQERISNSTILPPKPEFTGETIVSKITILSFKHSPLRHIGSVELLVKSPLKRDCEEKRKVNLHANQQRQKPCGRPRVRTPKKLKKVITTEKVSNPRRLRADIHPSWQIVTAGLLMDC